MLEMSQGLERYADRTLKRLGGGSQAVVSGVHYHTIIHISTEDIFTSKAGEELFAETSDRGTFSANYLETAKISGGPIS